MSSAFKHKCIKAAEKLLAKQNTRLTAAFVIGGDTRLVVATEKIDPKKRARPLTMMASHCPFCGAKL